MPAMQSAALGLALAGSLALGYSNVFVTAPSPENLGTLFSFIFRGLEALGYKVGGQWRRCRYSAAHDARQHLP